MNDEFALLHELVTGQRTHDETAFTEACHRRLVRALTRFESIRPGPADLAVLTRHALRREQEKQAGVSPTFTVPKVQPWPSPTAWESYGMDVVNESATSLHLRSRPWSPHWLPDAGEWPVDSPAAAAELRRDYGEPLPGDPFLHPFANWRHYRCAGQREAVRAVMMAPAGSTLVVNLPTGAGKSLCEYVPALTDPAGLSVVVVPTTALAIDQDRALAPYLPHPTAYYGGRDASHEERNKGIRERIRAGHQRIVFTSPESLVQSLAGPLYTAATHGTIRLLAIDEAHIVDQWGDDFRSEFQELAGLRQDLLRQPGKPFKTVLLTGTMTESCLDTLETLFGRPGPCAVLSAVQLRPEPSYWVAPCPDEAIRQERVFQAVRHLPRPLILYVSKVADAQTWLDRLHLAGFLRAATVTGATRPSERSEIVRLWQDDNLDLVVATSAFGLGVDKADIRAVIHACIPEHIDRFYQEVGRGGRDGRASVSLLLCTPEDREVARDLNQKTIITTEKGYARWQAMFFRKEELPDSRIRIPVDVVPEYRFGESSNSAHVAWNVRTLALLARSGVIELDAQPPPRRDQFLGADGTFDEDKFQKEFERHRNQRVLRIAHESHLDLASTWQGTIENSRRKSACATRRGLDLMSEALAGSRCFADIFADAYEIALRTGEEPRAASLVSRSCGGCPACRRLWLRPRTGVMPTPRPAWLHVRPELPADLSRLLGTSQEAMLFDDLMERATGSDRQRRERLVRYLVAKGIRSIVAPAEELDWLRPLFSTPASPPVFFDEEWQPLLLPQVPVLIIRPPTPTLATILRSVGRSADLDAPRILWLPAHTRDPEKPHCLLAQRAQWVTYAIEEFCTRVGV